MNFWEFLIAFLHEIAWPSTAIVLVYLLRREIRSLLPRITRLKAWGVEAELDKAVEAIAEELPETFAKESKSSSSSTSTNTIAPLSKPQKDALKDFITNKLSRAEYLVIVLHYYEELTTKEIALTLEMTQSQVRKTHQQALLKLKSVLMASTPEAEASDA